MAEKEQQVQPGAAPAAETTEEAGLLDQIIADGRLARDDSQKNYAKENYLQPSC